MLQTACYSLLHQWQHNPFVNLEIFEECFGNNAVFQLTSEHLTHGLIALPLCEIGIDCPPMVVYWVRPALWSDEAGPVPLTVLPSKAELHGALS
jgi:hypothetical protein